MTPSGDNSLTALYLLVGANTLIALGGFVTAFIKWLGARTVEREDKDKQKVEDRLDEVDERFDKFESTIQQLDKSLGLSASDVNAVRRDVHQMTGTVAEIRTQLDQRFDKQADFYRGMLKENIERISKELEELEVKLRQDTTRAISDVQQINRRRK